MKNGSIHEQTARTPLANMAPRPAKPSKIPEKRAVVLMPDAMPARWRGTLPIMAFCVSPQQAASTAKYRHADYQRDAPIALDGIHHDKIADPYDRQAESEDLIRLQNILELLAG